MSTLTTIYCQHLGTEPICAPDGAADEDSSLAARRSVPETERRVLEQAEPRLRAVRCVQASSTRSRTFLGCARRGWFSSWLVADLMRFAGAACRLVGWRREPTWPKSGSPSRWVAAAEVRVLPPSSTRVGTPAAVGPRGPATGVGRGLGSRESSDGRGRCTASRPWPLDRARGRSATIMDRVSPSKAPRAR